MPELQPAILNRDQTGSLCAPPARPAAAGDCGAPQDRGEISGFLGGSHQQQMLGGRRQPGDPLREDSLDTAAEWQRLWQRCHPGTLCRAQHGGELQQRERVPRCPGHELVAHPIGQPGSSFSEKCRGRRGLKAAQSPLRKTRGREVALVVVPRAEQQHNTLGL